jgi:cell division protein FtsB
MDSINSCLQCLKESIESSNKESSLELLKSLKGCIGYKNMELQTEIDELRNENEDLEAQVDNLEFELEYEY